MHSDRRLLILILLLVLAITASDQSLDTTRSDQALDREAYFRASHLSTNVLDSEPNQGGIR
jgi:hypothetical protein